MTTNIHAVRTWAAAGLLMILSVVPGELMGQQPPTITSGDSLAVYTAVLHHSREFATPGATVVAFSDTTAASSIGSAIVAAGRRILGEELELGRVQDHLACEDGRCVLDGVANLIEFRDFHIVGDGRVDVTVRLARPLSLDEAEDVADQRLRRVEVGRSEGGRWDVVRVLHEEIS